MNKALLLAAAAALCFAGCKKKEQAAGSGSDTVAAAPAPAAAKPAEPAPAGAKPKSCEELGGKKVGDSCAVKTPAPIDVTFTGKFDTDVMHNEPGAVFKVTNKTAAPVKVSSIQIYAYDKSGKQLDLDLGGSKAKYSQESQRNMIELDPSESKDVVQGLGKKNLPADMDSVQVEVIAWSVDGTDFSRDHDNDEVRPKDGWK